MIDFIDEKYGRVVIYDIGELGEIPTGESIIDAIMVKKLSQLSEASVVGYRNLKKRKVKILKNRYASIEDYETEQFVLNYGVKKEKEVYDPIKTRFEILDL